MNISLQQLHTLSAIVEQGSIQAAALYLHKTHPSLITAIKKLEAELGFALFDRSGYRSVLTAEGEAFYRSSQQILLDEKRLQLQAAHLKNAEEVELTIVIGDISPIPQSTKVLKAFFQKHQFTQLNLLFENLEGVNERLLNDEADLIIHCIDQTDPRYEYQPFCEVELIPVIAPDYLDIPLHNELKYSDIHHLTQSTIKSTAINMPTKDYFLQQQTAQIKVGDQNTKKEIILQGMAWGHMPLFLVEKELQNGRLLSLAGKFIKSHKLDIVVARSANKIQGKIANRLWEFFSY